MESSRLDSALRALPRAQASPDFTTRLLARMPSRAPSQSRGLAWPWGALAAAAAGIVLWVSVERPAGLDATPPGVRAPEPAVAAAGAPLGDAQVEVLRARREELERELLALRRLAAEVPQVVGIEGPSADYLVDLRDLAGPYQAAGAAPASWRSRR
jgi:hypothetical protein